MAHLDNCLCGSVAREIRALNLSEQDGSGLCRRKGISPGSPYRSTERGQVAVDWRRPCVASVLDTGPGTLIDGPCQFYADYLFYGRERAKGGHVRQNSPKSRYTANLSI